MKKTAIQQRNQSPLDPLTTVSEFSTNGNGLLSGKTSKQKAMALLLETQKQIADLTVVLGNNIAEKKMIQYKLKHNPVGMRLKTLNNSIKDNSMALADLSSRYQGTLETCKRLGIDLEMKNLKMLQEVN